MLFGCEKIHKKVPSYQKFCKMQNHNDTKPMQNNLEKLPKKSHEYYNASDYLKSS